MRERLRRFMQGRYGSDQLSKFMVLVALVFLIIYFFTGQFWAYWVGLVLILINCFRVFSRNVKKRYEENSKFLMIKYKVSNRFKGKTGSSKTARDSAHKIFTCPKCKQKVRVPRGKGKISITCPKCGNEFIKRT